MKRSRLASFLALIMLLSLAQMQPGSVLAASTTAPSSGGYWQRVEVIDFDGQESWDLVNQDSYYKADHSYSQGSFSSRIYHQGDDGYYAFGSQAIWTAPPDRIAGGETITLSVSLSTTENTHQNPNAGAVASADFADPGLGFGSRGRIDFADETGNTYATIYGAGPTSVSLTLSAVAPEGREGERIAIRVSYYPGVTMGTGYVYEWKQTPVVTEETPASETLTTSDSNPSGESTAVPPVPADAEEIPLRAKLTVRQAIAPPARTIDLRPDKNFLKKLLGLGTAVQTLECVIEGIPAELAEPVRVSFEIDKPSKIVGPSRRVVVIDRQASTQFIFNPSEASGQDGAIFAKVHYPASVRKVGDQYVPSENLATATIRIKPLCPDADSIYYKDNLISDLGFDRDALLSEFKAAAESFGLDRLTATSYGNLDLAWHLAHHGGTTSTGSSGKSFYTGQELSLNRYIVQQGQANKISPVELFAKALEMNQGDVTRALLTCHNVLRAAKSGRENFSDQLSAEDKQLIDTKIADYKKLSREQMARRNELESIVGIKPDPGIYENLQPVRPGPENNMGAWYHLFGTAVYSFNSQSGYASNILTTDAGDVAARLMARPAVWGEELLISGDIYSDPNEYCVDHAGIALGDELASVLLGRQAEAVTQAVGNYAKDWFKAKTSLKNAPYAERFSIRVKCPVNTTVVDQASGRWLRFDQSSQQIQGDLPANLFILMDGADYQLAAYVAAENLEIQCEAIADGQLTLEVFNLNTLAGAEFAQIPLSVGETLSISIKNGDASASLLSSTGQVYTPSSFQLSDQDALQERQDAKDVILAQVRQRNQDNRYEAIVLDSPSKGPDFKVITWVLSGILAAILLTIGLILLVGRIRKRSSQT